MRQQGTCSETGPRVTMPRSENLREGSRGWGRSSACSVKKDEARKISSSHSSDVSTLLTLSPGRGYACLPVRPWRQQPFCHQKALILRRCSCSLSPVTHPLGPHHGRQRATLPRLAALSYAFPGLEASIPSTGIQCGKNR